MTVTNSETSKTPSSWARWHYISQMYLAHSMDCRCQAEVSPSFTLNPGDVKMIHHLRSGGKLVVQKKKNGVSSAKGIRFHETGAVHRMRECKRCTILESKNWFLKIGSWLVRAGFSKKNGFLGPSFKFIWSSRKCFSPLRSPSIRWIFNISPHCTK